MKITQEHYDDLKKAISKVINLDEGQHFTMRARWDLLWASRFPTKQLYEYLNDTNIDAALKKIVDELDPQLRA